jgi:hypothetical protein
VGEVGQRGEARPAGLDPMGNSIESLILNYK